MSSSEEQPDSDKSRDNGSAPMKYFDCFTFDFVDARPGSSGGSRENVDAAGYGETTAKNDPPQETENLLLPIPTRKGSVFLDTPLIPWSNAYSMTGEQRGKVLIFNQVQFDDVNFPERDGTQKDVERLYHTLPRLGFHQKDIQVFEDLSFAEIQRSAVLLETDKDLETSDCLMVIILTHGAEGDMLMARDSKFHLYKFIENFTPTALKSMAGKPKLFVIQACRGSKHDRGVQLRSKMVPIDAVDSEGTGEIFSYPEFADLLIVMSSHHGHFSFRNEQGSWLVQELCNVIERCDLQNYSIWDILTETNDAVSKRESFSKDHNLDKKKQISSFYSTLTKQLYFRPAK